MHYRQPGQPAAPPQAQGANSYLPPGGPRPQLPVAEAQPIPPSEPPHANDLLAEWRAHHADTWVRADDLNPAVRRMIDERERLPAIRQRLRQLVATCRDGFNLEAKAVGNRARPIMLYRVITEDEGEGLEG